MRTCVFLLVAALSRHSHASPPQPDPNEDSCSEKLRNTDKQACLVRHKMLVKDFQAMKKGTLLRVEYEDFPKAKNGQAEYKVAFGELLSVDASFISLRLNDKIASFRYRGRGHAHLKYYEEYNNMKLLERDDAKFEEMLKDHAAVISKLKALRGNPYIRLVVRHWRSTFLVEHREGESVLYGRFKAIRDDALLYEPLEAGPSLVKLAGNNVMHQSLRWRTYFVGLSEYPDEAALKEAKLRLDKR